MSYKFIVFHRPCTEKISPEDRDLYRDRQQKVALWLESEVLIEEMKKRGLVTVCTDSDHPAVQTWPGVLVVEDGTGAEFFYRIVTKADISPSILDEGGPLSPGVLDAFFAGKAAEAAAAKAEVDQREMGMTIARKWLELAESRLSAGENLSEAEELWIRLALVRRALGRAVRMTMDEAKKLGLVVGGEEAAVAEPPP